MRGTRRRRRRRARRRIRQTKRMRRSTGKRRRRITRRRSRRRTRTRRRNIDSLKYMFNLTKSKFKFFLLFKFHFINDFLSLQARFFTPIPALSFFFF